MHVHLEVSTFLVYLSLTPLASISDEIASVREEPKAGGPPSPRSLSPALTGGLGWRDGARALCRAHSVSIT